MLLDCLKSARSVAGLKPGTSQHTTHLVAFALESHSESELTIRPLDSCGEGAFGLIQYSSIQKDCRHSAKTKTTCLLDATSC